MAFQSSPDPKAGCYIFELDPNESYSGFQSSPDPKAGCYWQVKSVCNFQLAVSILTRPEGRVLQVKKVHFPTPKYVSILTRPEGRVLHRTMIRSYDN